jgi:hypothetical protein
MKLTLGRYEFHVIPQILGLALFLKDKMSFHLIHQVYFF